jgi:O-acetyl-ADP-ribose deacetylase (regulator of RNase III)
MIISIQEDIFNTKVTGAQAIIHQANCHCTMGSGIAKDIRAKFPEAYEADCRTTKGDIGKLGRASIAAIANDKKAQYPNLLYIVNLYGQFKFGLDERHTSYDALADGFERIRKWALEQKIKLLSVPFRLGCNRAGGDWQIVRSILDSVYANDPAIVMLICENPALTNGQVANRMSK